MTTWTNVEQLDPSAALRSVRLSDPVDDEGEEAREYQGLEVLGETPVVRIVRDLLIPQLPFRVKVYAVVKGRTTEEDEGFVLSRFTLPPIEISPLQLDGATTWEEFEESLKELFQWKVEHMEGEPSGWSFAKIDTLEFTFLASANMAALQQYLPVLVAGGKNAPLPQALKNKHCCIDVPSDFDQCLRHALMWPFLDFAGTQLLAASVLRRQRA